MTDRAAKTIANLAERYGWKLTTTDTLSLKAALSGKTPVEVSTTAGRANRHAAHQGVDFEPADLIKALQVASRNQEEQAKPPFNTEISEEHKAAAVTGIAAARAAALGATTKWPSA